MYFANGDGVLSYNGANWNLIQLPNKSTVISLGIGKNGKIWVGAIGNKSEFALLDDFRVSKMSLTLAIFEALFTSS